MNGPHGVYLIGLTERKTLPVLRRPLEVVEALRDDPDACGLRTVFLTVVDQLDAGGMRNIYADAFCDFVDLDYETRDAAAQWLLDIVTLKFGGG